MDVLSLEIFVHRAAPLVVMNSAPDNTAILRGMIAPSNAQKMSPWSRATDIVCLWPERGEAELSCRRGQQTGKYMRHAAPVEFEWETAGRLFEVVYMDTKTRCQIPRDSRMVRRPYRQI
jgi:hypothetical protein